MTPTPEQIRKAREDAGLSVDEAAAIIGKKKRMWQYYEEGKHPMSEQMWEYLQMKMEGRK